MKIIVKKLATVLIFMTCSIQSCYCNTYAECNNYDEISAPALTLGSMFSGLTSGTMAYYLFKKCDSTGCNIFISDECNPFIPSCFNENLLEILDKNSLLYKMIINENICPDCDKKYIFIHDTKVKVRELNRLFFQTSEPYSKLRIIAYSKFGRIDYKLYNNSEQIFFDDEKIDINEGILIKSTEICNTDLFNLDIRLDLGKSSIYAMILEFEN